MTTKPATSNSGNGKVLQAMRNWFRDTVDGPEPKIALEAARSPGFDPEHNALDAKILRFVTANYGQGWREERKPHLWERGSPDVKLAELFEEEDRLRTEFLRLENLMWQARDDLSATRRQDSGASGVEVVAVATKKLDESIKTWQAAKARLEVCMGRRTDRALQLQETYRRRAAAEGK